MVNKARLVERIAELVKEKRIDRHHRYIRDESGRRGHAASSSSSSGDANAQIVLNQLYYLHPAAGHLSRVIMLALVGGEPKTLTAAARCWTNTSRSRKRSSTRRTIFDLKKAKERAHILEGLMTALD